MVDSTPRPPTDLVGDCSRCCGLCCVAPAIPAGEDFADEKPAHVACRHLRADCSCAIHERLRERGYRGCALYDCAGAGQKVTQWTFGGRSWQQLPDPAAMYETFLAVRGLHELLVLLDAALRLEAPPAVLEQLGALRVEIESATYLDATSLVELDVARVRRRVTERLRALRLPGEALAKLRSPVASSRAGRP